MINSNNTQQIGVSPVIGVILMVAITVILGAVIGTFVLGVADGLDRDAQANISFEEVDGERVTLTVESVQSADRIEIEIDGTTQLIYDESGTDFNVGNEQIIDDGTAGISGYNSGDDIRVIGYLDGSENLIQVYETSV